MGSLKRADQASPFFWNCDVMEDLWMMEMGRRAERPMGLTRSFLALRRDCGILPRTKESFGFGALAFALECLLRRFALVSQGAFVRTRSLGLRPAVLVFATAVRACWRCHDVYAVVLLFISASPRAFVRTRSFGASASGGTFCYSRSLSLALP